MSRDGLLIDFGGVMTSNVFESFADFCRAEGLDPDTVRDRFRQDPAVVDDQPCATCHARSAIWGTPFSSRSKNGSSVVPASRRL